MIYGDKPILEQSLTEIREWQRPRHQPYRGTWDALHAVHVALLKANNRVSLREACAVADRKFQVYLDWQADCTRKALS